MQFVKLLVLGCLVGAVIGLIATTQFSHTDKTRSRSTAQATFSRGLDQATTAAIERKLLETKQKPTLALIKMMAPTAYEKLLAKAAADWPTIDPEGDAERLIAEVRRAHVVHGLNAPDTLVRDALTATRDLMLYLARSPPLCGTVFAVSAQSSPRHEIAGAKAFLDQSRHATLMALLLGADAANDGKGDAKPSTPASQRDWETFRRAHAATLTANAVEITATWNTARPEFCAVTDQVIGLLEVSEDPSAPRLQRSIFLKLINE